MAPRSCINSECGTTTTEDWRNGWALRSGGFANLCGNCGMAYEQSIFCDVFHGKESGWRECSCCGKRLHCGCVASRSFIVLLDNGGVQCLNCAKISDLSPPSEKGEDRPNHFVTSVAGRSIDYQVQSTMINGSFKQMKCEEVMLSIGDSSSQPWREKKSFSPMIPGFLGIRETDNYGGNSCVSLSTSSLECERKEQVHKGRQNHPKSLKSTLLRSSEMSKECISHLRIARPPADGRGRNHLLPRYWPRITDQELKQISGDSNSTIVPLFEKVLSASDAGRIGRLVLPKACAEAYFPPISQPEGLPLRIQDAKGKDWIFQFRFWPNNNSRMYVLEGVTPCIQSMQLRAGDTVTFSRIDPGGKLVLGFRKSTNSTSLQDSQVFTINGDETFLSNLHLPFLQPEKKRSRNISSKRKRLLIDSEESLELKLSWEEAQDLLRAPPNATPSIVVIEDHEFEEYEEPPILGKRTIFTIRSSGGDDQWVQCDNCGKWRRLPADAVVLSKWVCQDNVWDSERSSCFAPDEIGEREIHDLLLLSAELRKQKQSKNSAHPAKPASLETLATLAVMGPATATSATTDAAATTTRHPRHRPGCSCIVCIQPPSGKGPKHKPNCSCNVCLTVRRRFKTLMLRKKKRQSEQQGQQEAHFPLHQSEPISPDPTAEIDLNSCPDRGTMMSLLQVASLPLENYLKVNGLSSLASDHHASSSSATHLAVPPTATEATSGSPENS